MKRFFCFLLSTVVVFCLSACSNDNTYNKKIISSENSSINTSKENTTSHNKHENSTSKKSSSVSANNNLSSKTKKDTMFNWLSYELGGKHTPLKASEYLQYSTLTKDEKKLYNLMYKACKNFENYIILPESIKVKKNNLFSVYYKFMVDNPQFFYLSRYIEGINESDNEENLKYVFLLFSDGNKIDLLSGSFDNVKTYIIENADRTIIKNKIQQLNSAVNNIMKKIPKYLYDYNKEKAIFDYVIKNIDYNFKIANQKENYDNTSGEATPHAFDLYGAVVQKSAVCEGYSKMFQYLCYQTGINSSVAVYDEHMCNTVKIQGEWYYVDATVSKKKQNGKIEYKNFNVTTNEYINDKIIEEIYVPKCTATKYRYIAK